MGQQEKCREGSICGRVIRLTRYKVFSRNDIALSRAIHRILIQNSVCLRHGEVNVVTRVEDEVC